MRVACVKWFGGNNKANTLTKALTDYPPYIAPHTGDYRSLTNAQALENLDFFEANKHQRLDALHTLVGQHGIELKPSLYNGQHQPMIDALYQWAQSEWLTAVSNDVANRSVWRDTHRQAEQIIYSVAMDTAIALGEIVKHHRPAFAWAIDLDPDNINDGMSSARRVVLQAPSLLHTGQSVSVDWEELVIAILIKPQSAANRAINLWGRVCDEAISGATQGEHV